ncbi:MAG: class I SAM-dependent methyltransferase [Chitinophagales bacterium]
MRTLVLLFTTILFALTLPSCDNSNPHQGHDANKHMNESSFEDLVSRFEDSDRMKWQKPYEVIDKMGIAGKTVADIGAGTGYFAFRMLNTAKKVIAIDVDKRFIDYMEQKKLQIPDSLQTRLETRLAELNDPRLRRNEVNIILVVNTYHHIDDRIPYFRGLQKTLDIDGKLVIVDFKKKRTPEGPPKNMRMAAKDVVSELEEAGFTHIEVDEDTLPYQYIITAI